MRKRVATAQTGQRRILGTDWPVEAFVDRVEFLGRVRWVLTTGCCNGEALNTRNFSTRRQALEAFRAYCE